MKSILNDLFSFFLKVWSVLKILRKVDLYTLQKNEKKMWHPSLAIQ